MKFILYVLMLLPLVTINAYESCSDNKQNALYDLSSSIEVRIQAELKQNKTVTESDGDESIENRINTINNQTSNLSLVNVKYTKKGDLVCASIKEEDQIQNAYDMTMSALEIDEKNLPKNTDKKIQKLSEWLNKIDEVGYIQAAFYKPKDDEPSKIEVQKRLAKKEKALQDIYDSSIAMANSLIFKSCASTKESAYKDLNEKLFDNKTKQKDDEGFFDKTGSFLSSLGSILSSKEDKDVILDMFSKELLYKNQDKKVCAIIRKDIIKNAADMLIMDVKRFDVKSLSSLDKKRYQEIKNYQELLNVTKALLEVFPKKYTKSDFAKITNVKQKLAKILKDTNPQYVLFTISGAKNIKVTLDDKPAKINQKIYLKTGEHTYSITADGKCPIAGTFEVELKEDTDIAKSFLDLSYPTVLFVTDKKPNIAINGKSVQANVAQVIQQCKGSVRYIASYSGQSKSGEFSLSPDTKKTIELKFLTQKELNVYNDASTKEFKTMTAKKISQSLTPVSSKNLKFSLEDEPTNGEVKLHEAGSFAYVSNEGFVGIDSFSYIVEANGEESAPKIVNIIVANSNAPVAAVKKVINDVNKTINNVKETLKETKEEEDEKPKAQEEEKLTKERIDKFQLYLDSLAKNGDIEKMKEVQAKYPKEFEAVLKRKLNP
jgi:tetratricopeptide (TPR) repeat protein